MGFRQFAVKDIFTFAHDPAAVFGDERNLMRNLREKGDQLVILVAAGDHEADSLRLHAGVLRQKARPIIGLGIAQKSTIHVDGDQFNAHIPSPVSFDSFPALPPRAPPARR